MDDDAFPTTVLGTENESPPRRLALAMTALRAGTTLMLLLLSGVFAFPILFFNPLVAIVPVALALGLGLALRSIQRPWILVLVFILVAALCARVAPALGGMPYCGPGACN